MPIDRPTRAKTSSTKSSWSLVWVGTSDTSDNSFSLPLLAIGGVIVLILVLTIVAAIFGFLGLANKDQAMGLPEGSIRVAPNNGGARRIQRQRP